MSKNLVKQRHRGVLVALGVLLCVSFSQFALWAVQAADGNTELNSGYDVVFAPLKEPASLWVEDADLFAKVDRTVTACFEACHSNKGRSANGLMPKLEGQNFFYLLKQLNDYDQNNNESHAYFLRSHETMNKVMRTVDQGIFIYIADYISKLSCKNLSAASSKERQTPSEIKQCLSCHGEDGLGKSSHIPKIAGQPFLYLQKQFRLFQDTDQLKRYPANSDMRRDRLMSHYSHTLSAINEKLVLRHFSFLPCGG